MPPCALAPAMDAQTRPVPFPRVVIPVDRFRTRYPPRLLCITALPCARARSSCSRGFSSRSGRSEWGVRCPAAPADAPAYHAATFLRSTLAPAQPPLCARGRWSGGRETRAATHLTDTTRRPAPCCAGDVRLGEGRAGAGDLVRTRLFSRSRRSACTDTDPSRAERVLRHAQPAPIAVGRGGAGHSFASILCTLYLCCIRARTPSPLSRLSFPLSFSLSH